MRPDQLGDYLTPSDPRMHPDGERAAFVVTRMNLEEDRYERRIWLWNGAEARPLTAGPTDLAPRWSPDGSQLAFLRAGKKDKRLAQVAVLPIGGGEAAVVTEFELGVLEVEWSPDGKRIAVVAGEYIEEYAGLEPEERAKKPKRITRVPYRFDNIGWLFDVRSHIWLVDPAGKEDPTCLTPGDFYEVSIAWHPSGRKLTFVSARHDERGLDPGTQIWEVSDQGGAAEAMSEVGLWEAPSYDRQGHLHYIGRPDLWAHPNVYPLWRREDDGSLTDLTGDLERNIFPFSPTITPRGPRWADDGSFMSVVEDEGAIRAIVRSPAGETLEIAGGDRVITGVDPRRDGSAAVFVANAPTDPGEVWWWQDGAEKQITSLNDDFKANTTLVEPQRFTIDHDRVTVEGWAYLPEGEDDVPLLLNIHGGPATQYGLGFFDEFQVYAGAGYGVVATNPRGSSGYGVDFVRAVVGRWHEPMPPDIVDLIAAPDAAAAVFPRLDTSRMGVMGGSYGGFAAVRVTAADQRYRSSVAERGLYVWTSFAATSDIGPWFDRSYLGTTPPDGWETLWNASPMAYAHDITTPTLVLHSETDWRCPVEQAEQLFTLLLRQDVDTEFVRFPAPEGHELSRSGKPLNRQQRFEIILDWHERHLRSGD